jgi:hypothetical protein
MEIKLICACGTRFKFEVEPVHGRMPAPVNCPACGEDATSQANEFLRQPQPAAAAPIAVRMVSKAEGPGRATTPGAPPNPPSAPTSLRINRPSPATAEPAHATAPPPHPSPPTIQFEPAEPKKKGQWVTTLTAIVVFCGIGFGVWKAAARWYRSFKVVAEIASVINNTSANSPPAHQNFDYVDHVMLFIKHTNHLEVADACKSYWKEKFRKNLALSQSGEMVQAGEYQVIPEHNGYVRLFGTMEWPAPQYEAVSQHLSQKFNTMVFEVSDEDFSGAFHFGVYEQGTRKFHAKTEFKKVLGELEESVKTEGDDWALAHGYKSGPGGFNEFYLDDADQITQRLGMKFWDEPEGTVLNGMLMKETP